MRYKIKCIPVDIKDNRPVYEVEHIYYVTGRKEAVKKQKSYSHQMIHYANTER